MNPRLDLIWLSDSASLPHWPLGEVKKSARSVTLLAAVVSEHLAKTTADGWLFWDESLGSPDVPKVLAAFARPGDLWHAGLRLGMGRHFDLLTSVACTWMLACDPDPNIEATSWRLSLRACLLKTSVLRQMGGLPAQFQTLEGAALEFGHRCVSRGVLARHLPWLVPQGTVAEARTPPLEDELRFIASRYGRNWSRWALVRGFLRGRIPLLQVPAAWRKTSREPLRCSPAIFLHEPDHGTGLARNQEFTAARVTVLIPTIDRYPYLRTLLKQLRQQTVRPLEIIVVDQTAVERRDSQIATEFTDLPLNVIFQEEAGQCTSRNAGLLLARGDYVLFLDDDVELEPDLLETHLRNLARFRADVSSGVSNEVGSEVLPEHFRFTRVSDVFPAGNTLVRREALQRSGLFDLAYNRGQRADGDLGMRVYLSGALMVLNPAITVLHHHAPSGGLRMHKARVVTRASSRHQLLHRHLLSATEAYLARRYFDPQHLTEMAWISTLGTFSIRGGLLKKGLKVMVSLAALPHTLWHLRQQRRKAEAMLKIFPEIPALAPLGDEAGRQGQATAGYPAHELRA